MQSWSIIKGSSPYNYSRRINHNMDNGIRGRRPGTGITQAVPFPLSKAAITQFGHGPMKDLLGFNGLTEAFQASESLLRQWRSQRK